MVGVVENPAHAQKEAAILGVNPLRLPPPLEDGVARDATTSWGSLLADYAKRFIPGVTDFELLQRILGCRSKDQLARMAEPSLRRSFQLETKIDPEWTRYITEFRTSRDS